MSKQMDRETVIDMLKDFGAHVCGTTEEFDGREGGVWASGERGDAFDYYGYADTLGVRPDLCAALERAGWFAEFYDGGTVMVYAN
jgi:hypothetical protein